MLRFMREYQLVFHSGRFSQTKRLECPNGDAFAAGYDAATAPLRSIHNCIPTNEVRDIIRGQIRSLPQVTQWSMLQLLRHDCRMCPGYDQVAAFFIYSLDEVAAFRLW